MQLASCPLPRCLVASLPLASCLLLLTAAGFALRWRYATTINPHVDEFVSMLAAKMIVATGWPIMPSGLWYTHGLLFSYLDALFIGALGFSETTARLPSVLLGTLTIPLLYAVGRRLFSRPVGLVAAALLAFAPQAVVWGGRARMYALLQPLVLLAVYFAYRGVSEDKLRYRWLSLAGWLLAVLAQFIALLTFPPLVIGLLATHPDFRSLRRLRKSGWRTALLEALALAGVAFVAFVVRRVGQPKGMAAYAPTIGGGPRQWLEPVTSLLAEGLRWSWDPDAINKMLRPTFWTPQTLPLTVLAVLGLILLLRHARRGTWRARDTALAYVGILLVGTVLELTFLVSRRHARYLFMLLPLFFLAAGEGLATLGTLAQAAIERWRAVPRWATPAAAGLAVVVLTTITWPATTTALATQEWGYNRAFGYVRDHWQPGDAIMTMNTAASGLYLGRGDYFAIRLNSSRQFTVDSEKGPVDRWLGAPLVHSVEQLDRAMLSHPRVWFVVDKIRLTRYYEPDFLQELFALTDRVYEADGALVFLSKPERRVLSTTPQHPRRVNLGHRVLLTGYSLDRETVAPGETIHFILFWQAVRPMEHDYTVFIHLRDAAGRTVAQQDYQPFDGAFPTSVWRAGQTMREERALVVPADAPPGRYELRVGMYRLETMERLPVVDDASGENAIVLGEITIQ